MIPPEGLLLPGCFLKVKASLSELPSSVFGAWKAFRICTSRPNVRGATLRSLLSLLSTFIAALSFSFSFPSSSYLSSPEIRVGIILGPFTSGYLNILVFLGNTIPGLDLPSLKPSYCVCGAGVLLTSR